MKNQCCAPLRPLTKFNLSKGHLQWDGISRERIGEEFNLKEDLAWSFFHLTHQNCQFFFSAQYFAEESLFLYYVMVQGGQVLANQFRANVRLQQPEAGVTITFQGPVLAIDRVPNT